MTIKEREECLHHLDKISQDIKKIKAILSNKHAKDTNLVLDKIKNHVWLAKETINYEIKITK